jgi:protein-disulfide isomerase
MSASTFFQEILMTQFFVRSALFLTLMLGLVLTAGAEIEGRLVKTLTFPEPARQVAVSPDGKNLVALGQEKIYLATIQGEILGEWPVGKDISSVMMQSGSLVLLHRSGSDKVDYLLLDIIQQVELGDAPVKGNVDAPIAIVVFDDFQCPYCARLAPVLKQVQANNPQTVKLVFKQFPLNMHQFARPAALAAAAAGKQGKFWEMHDLLFANYNKLSEQEIIGFAGQLGLDLEKFNQDRNGQELQVALQQDLQQGQQLGIRGTPAVFVNGRIPQDRSEAGFQQLIEAELQRLNKAKSM